MDNVKKSIAQRIKELNEADKVLCEKRWNMLLPEMVRNIYREQSNIVTFARQELQAILKKIESTESEGKGQQQVDNGQVTLPCVKAELIAPSLNKRLEFAEALVNKTGGDMPVSAIIATTYWMQAEMTNLNNQCPGLDINEKIPVQ